MPRLWRLIRARRRAEEGLTLIEVVAALGVLGIVMLPLASLFFWGATNGTYNREQGDALAIANGFLAKANSLTYSALGFYESQCGGTVPGYNGQPGVDLGASPPAGVSGQVPCTAAPAQVVGNETYYENTYIVWVNGSGVSTLTTALTANQANVTSLAVTALPFAVVSGDSIVVGSGSTAQTVTASGTAAVGATSIPVTSFTSTYAQAVGVNVYDASVCTASGYCGDSYAYKQVYSNVHWNEGGHTSQLTQSILVYPGGLGKYTGPKNNIGSGGSTVPDNVSSSGFSATCPAGLSPCATQLQLNWTAPVNTPGFFVAVWATNPGHLATADTSGTGGGWSPTGSTASGVISNSATSTVVSGLASSTTYYFEIVAFSPDGTQWSTSQTFTSGATGSAPPPTCALGTLTVSQPGQSSGQAQIKNGTAHLMQAISMTVTYSGPCTAGANVVTVTGTSSGADPGSPYSLTWGPTQYTYSLCPNAGFNTGTHTYKAYMNGTVTSLTAQVSFSSTGGSAAC